MAKRFFIIAFLLSISLILLSFTSASGATYYISPAGNDSSNGLSAETSFQTIQKAVDAAQPGDTIVLAAGEYKQDIISRRNGSLSLPITITGPPEAVVKGGGNDRVIEINHNYHALNGFTVDGLYGSSTNSSSYRDILIFVHGKEKLIGLAGFKAMSMTLQNAGGECLRLRYFVTGAEIAYNKIRNCGIYDFVFNKGGKNGEGIYLGTSSQQWNDGKNPTSDPDETKNNHVHHNDIDTQGNECVDIKEGATANIIEYNACRGQKDPESGGFDSRGDNNIFRYNSVKDSVGAGIRLGGWLVKNIQYGKNNDIYGNVINDNKAGGIKFQVSPQGKVCGNQFSGNLGGDSVGTYASEFNPENPCPESTLPTPTPSTSPTPTSTPPGSPKTASLANNRTLIAHSNNFSKGYEPARLWDGCYEGILYDSTTCTAGGRDIPSFWLEFDLKKLYTISQARLYGDAEGTWVSKSWSLKYKQNTTDNWINAFSNEGALFNGWSTRPLNITARYIRVEVSGSEEYLPGQTQARELEIYGNETKSSRKTTSTSSPSQNNPSSNNNQSQGSSSGSSSSNQQASISIEQLALIEQLKASVAKLKKQILTLMTKSSALKYGQDKEVNCVFLRHLSIGLKGEDVKCLQRFLNSTGFPVSLAGPGSPGNETLYFGSLTKQAIISWQNTNASAVLAPLGLTSGTGYWGSYSIPHYKITRLNKKSI